MTNINFTDITLIVDESPSMQPQTKETIQGVNDFVKQQIAAAVEGRNSVKVNLVTFSTGHKALEGVVLSDWNYNPLQGYGTALYDAVGNTINTIGARLRSLPEAARPAKILVVIVTDGEENNSRSFTSEQVKAMIKHQQDEYKWDFVFLGANQDAWVVGGNLGFYGNKVMSFAPNAGGTQAAFASASAYATRSVQAHNMAGFASNDFNAMDVLAQANAGLDVTKLAVPDALKAKVEIVKDDGHEVTV